MTIQEAFCLCACVGVCETSKHFHTCVEDNVRIPNIIRQIKSGRMRWAGNVARMGEGKKVYKVLVRKPEVRDRLEDPGVDGIRMDLLRRLNGVGVRSGCS
jgi:hypothetical protein